MMVSGFTGDYATKANVPEPRDVAPLVQRLMGCFQCDRIVIRDGVSVVLDIRRDQRST